MKLLVLLLSLVASAACVAEVNSPYVGQETREIKALSPGDVQDYLSGKGMGLAKAAELNGYPGPSHVLALSSELGLTAAQKEQTTQLFASMQAAAMDAGKALIAEEEKLDRLFKNKTITSTSLSASLERIAHLQGQIRAIHLDAHLAQVRILTPQQVAGYIDLRGYSNSGAQEHHHH